MLKRAYLALIFLFYLSPCLFGNNDMALNIRFFDKTLYTTDSNVQVKIELKNQGTRPFNFKVADYKEYNLIFRVVDLRNRELPMAEEFQAFFQSSQPYFYRDVSLQPGEEFAFVVELGDYINLEEPGEYLVEAQFFPELHNLMGNRQDALVSNRIILSLRPQGSEDPAWQELALENEEVLRAQDLSPDEVISYTLEARQLDLWERFFLYTDLEGLLRENPLWERQFIGATEEEQMALVNSFKEDLRQGRILEYNSFIERPARFEILQTSYNQSHAQVRVREYFDSMNRDFTMVREYRYFLERMEGIWKIVRYEVTNVRTE